MAFLNNYLIREIAINTLTDVIYNQVQPNLNFRTAIGYFLSELTNNIADHSECSHGMIFAQTYPTKGYIDIIISDNGIGVLKSYLKSDIFNPANEPEAIEMAVNGNSTKDDSISRGFGLRTSRSMIVKGLKGRFFLWSGGSMFVDTPENQSIVEVDDNAYYKGCFIVLRLPIANNNNFKFYEYIEA